MSDTEAKFPCRGVSVVRADDPRSNVFVILFRSQLYQMSVAPWFHYVFVLGDVLISDEIAWLFFERFCVANNIIPTTKPLTDNRVYLLRWRPASRVTLSVFPLKFGGCCFLHRFIRLYILGRNCGAKTAKQRKI